MKHLENYYRNLCEQLQQQLAILEAKMKDKKKNKKIVKKGSKKEKMADKDYDGDGEVESSKDEYFGSKDKAIKKKMAEKKKVIKEGREVHGGIMNYGGFPRVLKENQAVTQVFQDSPDDNQKNVATLRNDQEVDLYVKGGMGLRYPSADYAKLGHEAYDLQTGQFEAQRIGDRATVTDIGRKRAALLKQMQAHPHHATFMANAERHENDVRGGNYGE
jgi:hypothetical protein